MLQDGSYLPEGADGVILTTKNPFRTFNFNFNHLSYKDHAQLALVHISMETPTIHNPAYSKVSSYILFLYVQVLLWRYKFMLTFSQNWATSALHRRFDALPTWPLWESTKWFRKIISVLSCPDTLLSAEVQTINHNWLPLYYCFPPTPTPTPTTPLEQDQCLITAWPPHTTAASLQHNRWAVGTAAMAESQEETMLCASHSHCHKTCFPQLLKTTEL